MSSKNIIETLSVTMNGSEAERAEHEPARRTIEETLRDRGITGEIAVMPMHKSAPGSDELRYAGFRVAEKNLARKSLTLHVQHQDARKAEVYLAFTDSLALAAKIANLPALT